MNCTDSSKRAWNAADVYVAPNGDMKEAHRQGVNFYKAENGEVTYRIRSGRRIIAANETFKRLAGAQNNLRAIQTVLDTTSTIGRVARRDEKSARRRRAR